MAAGKRYKRFAGPSVNNAGYHNENWDRFHGGNELRDVAYDSLADAITDIGTSDSKTLYITTQHRVTSSRTIPSNISVVVLKGGSFDIATGVTLTINRLQADDYHTVKTGSGTLAITALTYRRSAIWYGATGDGATSDSTAILMACSDLRDRCKLVFPSPSSYYRLTSNLEIADKNGAVIDFCPAWDTALGSIPDTYPLFYDGSALTGYENAVVRIVGCSYSTFHGLAVHANSKAEYALWYSGINDYTGSGVTTANRNRSVGNIFRGFANLGVNKCGARLGEDTSTSSQTDITSIHNAYFRSNTTGSSLGVDASPVYRGVELHGANTYIDFYTCEASGDTAWFNNAGTYKWYGCFALGDSREGWYINDQTSSNALYSCHAEGLSGRAVRIASGDAVSARVLLIDHGTFLHADKGSKTFDAASGFSVNSKTFNAATDIDTGTDRFTIAGHGYSTDERILVSLGGNTFPVASPVVADGAQLFAIAVDSDTLQFSLTQGGSAINFTAAGSGTITLRSNSFSISSHGLATDDMVIVGLSGATFPVTAATITDGTVLYAIRTGADTLNLSRTLGGSAIDFTADGSGTVTLTWRAAPMRFEGNMSVIADGAFASGWIGAPTGFTNAPPTYKMDCHWLYPTENTHNPDIQAAEYSTFTRANKENIKRHYNNLRQAVVDDSTAAATTSKGASFANYIVVKDGSGNSHTAPPAKKGMVIWYWKAGSGAMTINMPPEKTFDGATAMNTTTEILSLTGHDFLEGTAAVVDLNGGTFPVTATVITTGDTLYCGYIDTNTMYLCRSEALAFNPTPINFTSAGSGTIKLYRGQLQRHDNGGTASSVTASGLQEGWIELKCVQDGKWQVSSPMRLTYDGGAEYLTYSGTWDPGNMAADGDTVSTTVTVTGSATADIACASHDQIGANNVLISAHVQTADTVRVTLMNKTGGALDIASGTLTVHVRKA